MGVVVVQVCQLKCTMGVVVVQVCQLPDCGKCNACMDMVKFEVYYAGVPFLRDFADFREK